jgi:hypothetical protein
MESEMLPIDQVLEPSVQRFAPKLGSTGDVSAVYETNSSFLCFMPNAPLIHSEHLAIAHDNFAINHDQPRG